MSAGLWADAPGVAHGDNRFSIRYERIRRVLRTMLRRVPLWNKFGKCSSIRRLRSEWTSQACEKERAARWDARRRQWRQRRAPCRTEASRRTPAPARVGGAMGTTPPPAAAKQHKSRRKISLPWFRQSSVSAPHAMLSRQHTIDTPSSFHARLLKGNRQRQVIHRLPAAERRLSDAPAPRRPRRPAALCPTLPYCSAPAPQATPALALTCTCILDHNTIIRHPLRSFCITSWDCLPNWQRFTYKTTNKALKTISKARLLN